MSEKIIDWELADQLAEGDHAFAVEMMESFIQCLPEFQQNLKAASDKQDIAELKRISHKLYGATCYVGTPRVKAIAKAVELGNGDIIALSEKLMQEIDAVIKQGKLEIKREK